MYGIVISGHGGFATGMKKTLELVTGIEEDIAFIDFTEDVTPEKLLELFNEQTDQFKMKTEILFITDIKGGTPFNSGVLYGLEKDNVEVLSGGNLAMIIEAIDLRSDYSIKEAIDLIIEAAKDGIARFGKEIINDIKEEDGI